MNPVTQDVFGPEGNCMAACIASIFNLPLKEVPNFAEGNNNSGIWIHKMWEFCRSRGYQIVPYYLYSKDDVPLNFADLPEHLRGMCPFYLACGPAERGYSHATVAREGQMIWDPHPSGVGLIKVDSYYFLKPTP